jgi:hypothetical protein
MIGRRGDPAYRPTRLPETGYALGMAEYGASPAHRRHFPRYPNKRAAAAPSVRASATLMGFARWVR